MVHVTVKWGAKKFENLSVEEEDTVGQLKSKLVPLTGVDSKRQKLMAKGSLLKDDIKWKDLAVSEGQILMMMGTAAQIARASDANAATTTTPGDADVEKKDKLYVPAGLMNLGNTCYLNATLQCIRRIPELHAGILKHGVLDPTAPLTRDNEALLLFTLANTFKDMCASAAYNPVLLLPVYFSVYPQFNSRGEDGRRAQQDAEECVSLFLSLFASHKFNIPISSLFEGQLQATVTCTECPEEPVTTLMEPFLKLNCHIENQTSHLSLGIADSLEETFEKRSETLGRDAQFQKKSRISKLPPYLMVHFIRFFWKQSAKVKAKILKKVSYPAVLDVYSLCTAEYQAEIKESREAVYKAMKDVDARQLAASPGTLQEWSSDEGERLLPSGFYDLIGIITHVGRSADSGHYIAWVRDEKFSNVWWKFDDDKVSQVTEEEILKLDGGGDWHTAYLSFYKAKMS